MSEPAPSQNLRARTRETLRREVAGISLRLFIERGFDNVTAEEIARASGISQRSFFRYFSTKENAALAGLERSADLVAAALAQRPTDEPVWTSLEHAFATLIEAPGLEGLSPLAVSRLFVQTPSLRSRRFEKHQEWSEVIVPVLADRFPPSVGWAFAEVTGPSLVGAALSCLDTATEIWVHREGEVPAIEVLSAVFGAVASSTHQVPSEHPPALLDGTR